MQTSTCKSETMVFRWKRVEYPLQVGGEFLPQVEYLGVLFTTGGDGWIDTAVQ